MRGRAPIVMNRASAVGEGSVVISSVHAYLARGTAADGADTGERDARGTRPETGAGTGTAAGAGTATGT